MFAKSLIRAAVRSRLSLRSPLCRRSLCIAAPTHVATRKATARASAPSVAARSSAWSFIASRYFSTPSNTNTAAAAVAAPTAAPASTAGRRIRSIDVDDNSMQFVEETDTATAAAAATAPPAPATAAASTGGTAVDVSGGGSTRLGSIIPLLVIQFNCSICNVQSTKKMSKESYEKGVVLIRCNTCKSVHLIADNLGWFGPEATNIESLMQEKGEAVSRRFSQFMASAEVNELVDAAHEQTMSGMGGGGIPQPHVHGPGCNHGHSHHHHNHPPPAANANEHTHVHGPNCKH